MRPCLGGHVVHPLITAGTTAGYRDTQTRLDFMLRVSNLEDYAEWSG
jgi:hypothetical protein